ncbi:MAG: HEAT repeat domain-containing protein [Phycisphaerales bacterium]
MRRELKELLDRFGDEGTAPGSTQTIAWHAHREAEHLRDRTMVDELVEFVAHERDRWRRNAAYFIIGKIGQSLSDPTCAEVMIGWLGREKVKFNLSCLLDRIGDISKPATVDLSSVYALMGDARWLVRRAAIAALKRSENPEAERRVLAHLANGTDPYDIIECNATLNDIGTARAIPFLEANLKSRKRDVRGSAKFALESIRARAAAGA